MLKTDQNFEEHIFFVFELYATEGHAQGWSKF